MLRPVYSRYGSNRLLWSWESFPKNSCWSFFLLIFKIFVLQHNQDFFLPHFFSLYEWISFPSSSSQTSGQQAPSITASAQVFPPPPLSLLLRIKRIFFLTGSCQKQRSCPNRNKISFEGQRSGKRRWRGLGGRGCVNGNRKGLTRPFIVSTFTSGRALLEGDNERQEEGRKKQLTKLLLSRVFGTEGAQTQTTQTSTKCVCTQGAAAMCVCVRAMCLFPSTSPVNPRLFIIWSYCCALERQGTHTMNMSLIWLPAASATFCTVQFKSNCESLFSFSFAWLKSLSSAILTTVS